jgi:protein O-mannosyl-transferase
MMPAFDNSPVPIERRKVAALCLVLAAMTFAVFGQTLHHEFVTFDDGDYVYDNPVVAQGLTLKGIVWAFSFHSANWHPLTWLSHELDCQIYGLHPGGHHLTNVLLQTATVILLFLVLRQMTGALWRSAFVAAVFAIHPLRVESVAWVAERKDVLSGVFFILTIWAYVRYAEEFKVQGSKFKVFYGLCLVFFILGLMSKPMLVTLPLVLLLLDFWPLQRTEPARSLVMEKLPLLALSAAACVATLAAQHQAIQSSGSHSLPNRLGQALVSCVVYLGQMVYPARLAVFYPFPKNGLPAWEVALAGLLLACLSAVAWAGRRSRPWLLVGWVWYLVMLLPVSGVIQTGPQANADRYTYLPQIGLYVALTWLAAEWPVSRAVLGGLMAGALAALMVCAGRQTAYWQNSETLWSHTLACTTDNEMARNALGFVFFKQGKLEEAITQYQEALRINPNSAEARSSLGSVLFKMGKVDESIIQYQSALRSRPDFAEAHLNLGSALDQEGRWDEAIVQFQEALRIKPDYAEAHLNLGATLAKIGQLDEAIVQFQDALKIKPDYTEAHLNLGTAFDQKGHADEAMAHFQEALKISPASAEAHLNLGVTLAKKGQVDAAIAQFQEALKISPDNLNAHINLGTALANKSRVDEAIVHFQKALELARAAGQQDLAARLNSLLQNYQAGLPPR